MAYCGPKGIALDVFLGWPQESQDAALEWAAYESRRCSSCGTHPDEPERHAHTDICPGCIRMDEAARDARAEAGAHVSMVPGSSVGCQRCRDEHEANRY